MAGLSMSTVGEIEKKTQERVVRLFSNKHYPSCLGYDYLGDWTEREGNRNIEEALLRKFLYEKQRYDEALIARALPARVSTTETGTSMICFGMV